MVVAQPGYVRGDKFQSWVAMVCSHNRKAAVGEVGVMEEEERTVATDTSNAMVGMVESRCDAAHLCTSLTHPDQAGQVLSTPPSQLLSSHNCPSSPSPRSPTQNLNTCPDIITTNLSPITLTVAFSTFFSSCLPTSPSQASLTLLTASTSLGHFPLCSATSITSIGSTSWAAIPSFPVSLATPFSSFTVLPPTSLIKSCPTLLLLAWAPTAATPATLRGSFSSPYRTGTSLSSTALASPPPSPDSRAPPQSPLSSTSQPLWCLPTTALPTLPTTSSFSPLHTTTSFTTPSWNLLSSLLSPQNSLNC